jgi:arylsulfatase A-like enzyme
VCDALVEAIDLVPSFLSWFGGTPQPNVIEGRSLLPLLRGETPPTWRSCVFSEYDYAMMPVRRTLGTPIDGSRLFMVFDGRWKYIHAPGFRPMLYDLHDDPAELLDRGADPACAEERARLKEALLEWALRDHNRITMPDARIAAYGEAAQLRSGILIGYWSEDELRRARADFGLG